MKDQYLLLILLVLSVILITVSLISAIAVQQAPAFARHCPMCRVMWSGLFPAPLGLISLLAGFTLLALSIFYVYSWRERRGEGPGSPVLGLLETEKRALELISRSGQMTQRDLARELGFTRVKVHRLVKQLERRGLIETAPYGKTRMIRARKPYQGESAEAR